MYLFFYLLEKLTNASNSLSNNVNNNSTNIKTAVDLLSFMDDNIAKTFLSIVNVVISQNSVFFKTQFDFEITFYSVLISVQCLLAAVIYLRFILPKSSRIQGQVVVSARILRIVPKHVLETLPSIRNIILNRLYN